MLEMRQVVAEEEDIDGHFLSAPCVPNPVSLALPHLLLPGFCCYAHITHKRAETWKAPAKCVREMLISRTFCHEGNVPDAPSPVW